MQNVFSIVFRMCSLIRSGRSHVAPATPCHQAFEKFFATWHVEVVLSGKLPGSSVSRAVGSIAY
jgi:hypothetical protein